MNYRLEHGFAATVAHLLCASSAASPLASGGFLAANKFSGLDSAEIFVTGNEERILISARFDNLGKGASGAAMQCLNIKMNCSEEKGLRL